MTAKPKRREVVMPLKDAAAQIDNGMTIAVGGFGSDNHPMAVVREIIKRGVKDLTVIGSATAGLDIDMLIGAGCVKKLIACYVYILYAGLFAGASGMDFFAWRGGIGSSIPTLNKDLVEFTDPIGKEKKYLAVPALRADWAIIHVGWSDPFGNGQHFGAPFGDRWLARAADRIMLQAERVVPNDLIRKNPFMTSVSYADCVVEAPYGAHPFAAHGFYREDVDHLKEYVGASDQARRGDTASWDRYLKSYVTGPSDHVDYLDKIGLRKLLDLYTPPVVTW